MVIGPLSAPHVLAPLVAMAQEINVAKPGRQPDPCSAVSEDMRLVCPQLVDKNGEQRVASALAMLGLGCFANLVSCSCNSLPAMWGRQAACHLLSHYHAPC